MWEEGRANDLALIVDPARQGEVHTRHIEFGDGAIVVHEPRAARDDDRRARIAGDGQGPS
jgi:hypothetical protein